MLIPRGCPDAVALVAGDPAHPGLTGRVKFYQTPCGVIVSADVQGLPMDSEYGVFAFHIHEGEDCGGEGFADSKGHFNPEGKLHPGHAGDLPPLFSNGGRASMAVLTDRFRVSQVIGRTVIIHSGPDDFHTQPSGNPGSKIACGVIRRSR
ncbi:MAG: superoxide dismutase family protein [Oscillospiraceae bacterium]